MAASSASSGGPPRLSITVGQSEERENMKAKLYEDNSSLKIISITGPPGIGKTTLATSIYEDIEVQYVFTTRSWVTVSQESQLSEILINLLNTMDTMGHRAGDAAVVHQGAGTSSVEQLKNQLHQLLSVAKYLVVVDDMSDNRGVWNEVKKCLPDEKNGSRVILTTRFAIERGSRCVVQPLSEEDSWVLLRIKAFGSGPWLDSLEKTGMMIANNCGGVPLLLTAIGDLLFRGRKTEEYWGTIRDETYAAAANGDEESSYSEILSLSYNHHLKKPTPDESMEQSADQ